MTVHEGNTVIPAAEIASPLHTLPGDEELNELESLLKGRLLSLSEIQRFVGFGARDTCACPSVALP